jgi:plastocyanin
LKDKKGRSRLNAARSSILVITARISKILIIIFIVAGTGIAPGAEEKGKVFTATVDDDGIQRVEVLGGEYFFDPDHIVVKVGVPVELKVKKEPGIVPHNIVIEKTVSGIEIRENLSKKPEVISFTPEKTGKYPFFCDKKLLFFKSHREKGMEGIFEVIE